MSDARDMLADLSNPAYEQTLLNQGITAQVPRLTVSTDSGLVSRLSGLFPAACLAAALLCLTPGSPGAGNAPSDPSHSNRLAGETSPYLLLHAHNPVDWYPWGEEAFARARREDLPIFLSVGYSTCYWCHVMEREVFADPEIAVLMNQWFVNVKVDREERPDIDRIYMTATQMLTRHGGWPNSVFMTPELEPFYAGTYFPPEDRYGRPGFPSLLRNLRHHWLNSRERVDGTAAEVAAAIRARLSAGPAPPRDPDTTLVLAAADAILGRYDGTNGGFGGAPKFPPSIDLEFLMHPWVGDRREKAASVVDHTLRAMADGGIYDQVGGGFHRYATDARWRVPHFEKMLYNQAQLARLYTRAFSLTGEERWRLVAEDILRFVDREMTSPEGPFYSALDAETETVEGKYYIWTEAGIRDLLGPEQTHLFFEIYGLAPMPEGHEQVVFRRGAAGRIAAERGWSEADLAARAEPLRTSLRKARNEREYPLLDDKIITSWNGMMIAACAEAAAAFDDSRYRLRAEKAARFLLERMRSKSGELKRVYRNETAKQRAFLEDYAFLAEGLLALHRATGEEQWLVEAGRICDQMIVRFRDPEGGGLFFSEGGADLIARSTTGTDSALPSPNAVAAVCLLQLARETGDSSYRDHAAGILRLFAGAAASSPAAYTHLAAAAADYLTGDRKAAGSPGQELPGRGGPEPGQAPLQPEILALETSPAELRLKPGGSAGFRLLLRLADGWHVNSNPASNDWLIPTSLIANSDLPVRLASVDYPAGRPLYLEALGETLSVYDGGTAIAGRVDAGAAAGASGELRLLLQYQACDDSRCLPPAEVSRTLPLTVE